MSQVPDQEQNHFAAVKQASPIRVILVDDQRLFVESLRDVITSICADIQVVGIGFNGKEAIELVKRLKPDIALIDIQMPVLNGIEATGVICEKYPNTQVIILTTHDTDTFINGALSKGAVGYLLKETQPSNVVMSILAVKEGSVLIAPAVAKKLVSQLEIPCSNKRPNKKNHWLADLTVREKEVLSLLSKGLDNKAISKELFVEVQSIRNYVCSIYSKIGVHSRIEVMLKVNQSDFS